MGSDRLGILHAHRGGRWIDAPPEYGLDRPLEGGGGTIKIHARTDGHCLPIVNM
jgi:hypothetical protein